jgi:hypothetical protein
MNFLTESGSNFTCVGHLFFHVLLVVKQAHSQDVFNKTDNVRINVTLGCVRVTIVAVKQLYLLHGAESFLRN